VTAGIVCATVLLGLTFAITHVVLPSAIWDA
jgi:hypothetical protein